LSRPDYAADGTPTVEQHEAVDTFEERVGQAEHLREG
jgi:hypothetical protein